MSSPIFCEDVRNEINMADTNRIRKIIPFENSILSNYSNVYFVISEAAKNDLSEVIKFLVQLKVNLPDHL